MKYKFFAVLLLAATSLAASAFATPPYNVDDPATIEPGHFRLETAYVSSQSKGKESETIPSETLKYGLNDNTQLSLGTGVISKRVAKKEREFGLADTTLGVKWRFKNENKIDPQWAIGYQLKLPTSNKALGLGTGRFDNKLTLCAAKSFQRLKFFGNLGYQFVGDIKTKNTMFYGLGATFQATEKLIVGAQWYGNEASTQGKQSEAAWGVGMKYNIAPDRTLLLQLGRSERHYSDLNVYAGFAFNFK